MEHKIRILEGSIISDTHTRAHAHTHARAHAQTHTLTCKCTHTLVIVFKDYLKSSANLNGVSYSHSQYVNFDEEYLRIDTIITTIY